MKPTVVILLDYQNKFTSKWAAKPYKSGMDVSVLKKQFKDNGFNVDIKNLASIDLQNEDVENKYYLYPSSEDVFLQYKSFIEDVIYGLELKNAVILPSFKLLRAHHNKVFMEILRSISGIPEINTMKAELFGTYEEFLAKKEMVEYPCVIKDAEGASSLGVQKANNENEAIQIIKKISRSRNWRFELWDYGRKFKHDGYKPESKHRRKFIIQKMLPNLDKDWKILIFGDKYYILERSAKKNDFRASGSGKIAYPESIPEGILDFAETVFDFFDVPFFAMDIGKSNGNFVLIEFQGVYFGTHTLDTSPYYFVKNGNDWERINGESIVEIEYARSVIDFINKKQDLVGS